MLAIMLPAPVPSCNPSSSHKRPRGLWKRHRETPSKSPKMAIGTHDGDTDFEGDRRLSPDLHHDYYYEDDDICSTSSGSSSKRRRYSGHFTNETSPITGSGSDTPLSDYASRFSAQFVMSDANPKTMAFSDKGKQPYSVDYEDWENLKELFASAAEKYDADDIREALPLLRAVIRECHRFLTIHPDPSVVFAEAHHYRQSRSPDAMTPSDERLYRDWGADGDAPMRAPRRRRSIAKCAELPTAFHAIFGITLFLMGNLVAQDASVAIPGEPDSPSTYWLAALDVFETGENLPSRTDGGSSGNEGAEDWRMAIVWGRTLVCLADEKVTFNMKLARERACSTAAQGEYCYYPAATPFSMSEPQWPSNSPFHAIAACRPPVTRRMSLYSASAHDIMVLAMDQFSRGIFHMPHPHYSHSHNPSHLYNGVDGSAPVSAAATAACPNPVIHFNAGSTYAVDPVAEASFSRAKELFTIASEVLGVAERLVAGSQRHYWASWADSVFNQMKNEADMDVWRGPILSARGRCWLIMGSAPVEDMEPELEAGNVEVLHSAEAEEAREGLAMAISFFERAKGSATSSPIEDVSPLLAEALLVLANLTADENKREELYSRAQAEAGESIALDFKSDDGMDTS